MGIISITRASERLQTPATAPVRQVHIPNQRIDRTTGKPDVRASQQAIAKGVHDLGRSVMQIALDMTRERRQAEDNETEAAFERQMRDAFLGVEGKPGILGNVDASTDTAGLEGAATAGQELVGDKAIRKFLDDRNYSRTNRDGIMLRLQRVSMPYENRLQTSVLGKSREISIASADRLFEEKQRSWQLDRSNPTLTADVIDAFAQAQEKRGVPDDKVAVGVDKIWRSMAYDIAQGNIREASPETVRALEEDLDTDPEKLYSGEPEERTANEQIGLYFKLQGKGALGPEEIRNLKTVLAQRKAKIDEELRDEALQISAPGFEAANTLWDPADQTLPNPNRLEGTEAAIKGLRRMLDWKNDSDGMPTLPEGSAARATAARDLAQLEGLADSIAGEELMLSLIEAERENPKNPKRIWYFEKRDANGKVEQQGGLAPDILPGTRKARLAQKVQAQFDAQTAPRVTERHADAVAKLEMMQLEGAHNLSEYRKAILDAALAGDITVSEWDNLYKSFDERWTKGSEGRIAKKRIFAEAARSAIQAEFGGDLAGVYTYNPKTGRMDFDKKSGYEGLSFDVNDRDGFAGFVNGVLLPGRELQVATRHYLSAADVGELIHWAGELARYDGEVLGKDPVTGSTDEDLFGRKINPQAKFDATDYFKNYVHKMKTDKWVDKNIDYIDMLSEAALRLQDADDRQKKFDRWTIEEAADERQKPPALIKKPNVKAVGVAPKRK